MNLRVVVSLRGCDDTTHIPLVVSEAEFAFLERLSEASDVRSACDCQPTLSVRVDAQKDRT